MKKILHTLLLLAGLTPFSAEAQFYNGNLESGTLAAWRAYTGSNSGGSLNLSTFVEGAVSGRHTIVTPANDPEIGATINRVFPPGIPSDTFSVRLGNGSGGGQAEILSFQVYNYYPPSMMGFSMAFIGNQNHNVATSYKNPFISIWVSRSNTLATSMDPGQLLADTTIRLDSLSSFFTTRGSGNRVYREWTRFELDDLFPSLAGPWSEQFFTIYFATADCTDGGHFGYAYIDNVSNYSRTVASFTAPATFSRSIAGSFIGSIRINGSASVAESSYSFEIVRCSASGVPLFGAPTYTTATYSGFVPSNLNLRPIFDMWVPSTYWVSDAYYRIKLKTWNTGTDSEDSTTRVIQCRGGFVLEG
ncbi:MAG: hypothetical protein BGO31_09685 [Bacteroidetes bacterium 43-16]|nr:MAG: hypothetical protein BGO31_09685 [Bacteroidetes bacterium 43-16]